MSFIIKQDEQRFNPEFIPVAERLAHLQDSMDTADKSLQLTRMEMIGICEEQKKIYQSQRSPEARFINQGYKDNGWDRNIIFKSSRAYQFRESLYDKEVPEYTALADACSMTQLYELADAQGEDPTVVFHAMKLVDRTGKAPSKSQIIGHKQGNTNEKFEFYSTLKAEKRRQEKLRDAQEAEFLPGENLADQSEFLPGENLADPSDQPLRNFVPLLNNRSSPVSDHVRDQVSKHVTSQVEVNPVCGTPSTPSEDKPSTLPPSTGEPISAQGLSTGKIIDVESIDVVSTPSADVSFKDFYKFVEKFSMTHYKSDLSEDDKQHLDRAIAVMSRFFKLN